MGHVDLKIPIQPSMQGNEVVSHTGHVDLKTTSTNIENNQNGRVPHGIRGLKVLMDYRNSYTRLSCPTGDTGIERKWQKRK